MFRVSKGNVISHFREIESEDLVIPNDEENNLEKDIIDPKNVSLIYIKIFYIIYKINNKVETC